MQRIEQTPQIAQDVKQNRAVVSCAYAGWVPQDILKQLPEGFDAVSWAAEIVDGKIVRLASGIPERIISAWLADQPAPQAPPQSSEPEECAQPGLSPVE